MIRSVKKLQAWLRANTQPYGREKVLCTFLQKWQNQGHEVYFWFSDSVANQVGVRVKIGQVDNKFFLFQFKPHSADHQII